jgi:hypothetical protein
MAGWKHCKAVKKLFGKSLNFNFSNVIYEQFLMHVAKCRKMCQKQFIIFCMHKHKRCDIKYDEKNIRTFLLPTPQ